MLEELTSWTGLECSASVDPYSALPPIVIIGKAHDVREGTRAVRAYESMMCAVQKNDSNSKTYGANY
jgi:hypothetical protein